MNWGILGTANIARRSVIPAILSVEGSKLIAVASRTSETANLFSGEFGCIPVTGYENLLLRDDIDAVYIPLPTGIHFEWVIRALNNDKHVLVEKSAAVTLAEADEMVNLAKRKNLALVENFQFQHHSQHQFVFNLLNNKEIGEIRSFRASFGFPPFASQTNIRYDKNLGGGALLDSGAYVLKATNFIMGNGFEVQAAYLRNNDTFDVNWFGGAFLVNQDIGAFSEVAFGFDNYYQCNYEIWGSKGKIICNRAYTASPDYVPSLYLEKNGAGQEILLAKDNHFINMIRYFEGNVRTKAFQKDWNDIIVQAKMIEDVRLFALR
jgi:NDP-hexose-3-ketoreductase